MNEIKFLTKHSTSYKYSYSNWYFAIALIITPIARGYLEKIKIKQKKLHKKVAPISDISLLIIILFGNIYSFLQPLGKNTFWLT